jgi:dATP pyrophosphohydrolase
MIVRQYKLRTAMEYKRPESVLVLVYTSALQVLLLQRVMPPVGVWQSITGALAWNENVRQAAERELHEETAITASADLLDTGVSHCYAIVPEALHLYAPNTLINTEYILRLRLPAVCEVRPDPREHSAYIWLPAAEAAARAWSWSNRQAILALLPRPEPDI